MRTLSKSNYARLRGVTHAAISKACRLHKLRTQKVIRYVDEVVVTDAEYQQYKEMQRNKGS